MSKLHPIISTLLKRIGLGIISLFFVTLIIFSSVNLLPGDFVESVLGQTRTEESVKIFRKELGLDKPYHVRYVNWLTSAIQGDLGSTFSGRNATYANQPQQNTARSVSSLLKPRLFNTFFLAAMTAIIAIPLSLILGITAADCLPIIFYDPKNHVIGIAHAGWKGLVKGVIQNTLNKMIKLGAQKKHIKSIIGPCIRVGSYEVNNDFVKKLKTEYQKFAIRRMQKIYFDLPKLAKYILLNSNISGVHDTKKIRS